MMNVRVNNDNKKIRTIRVFNNTVLYSLLSIGILLFVFALMSGAENYGGGLGGIIKNTPNALPWLAFLFFVIIAWKWQLISGIVIFSFGVFGLFYFVLQSSIFYLSVLILFLVICILGLLLILSWYLMRRNT
jgi:hypothetical protein